jgi:hypothetical protein
MHLRSALSLLFERRISYRGADRRYVFRSDGILSAECRCCPWERRNETLEPHLVILTQLLYFFLPFSRSSRGVCHDWVQPKFL